EDGIRDYKVTGVQTCALPISERQSLLALLSARRLALKQLNRPADALRYYRATKVSTVPHLDWEANIQAGIQAAEKAAGVSIAPEIGRASCRERGEVRGAGR